MLLIVLAGAIGSASASEQITTDPTRPPAGFAAEAPKGAVAGNQLQSVMISPTRKSAIINGVAVELGKKYGDSVLTKVAEDEVVQAVPVAPAAESGAPKSKPKAKPKAKTKPKTKPKTSTQSGAKPVAGSSAGTR